MQFNSSMAFRRARWVQETFGAQIELRRQAAGLQPNPAVAALAPRGAVTTPTTPPPPHE